MKTRIVLPASRKQLSLIGALIVETYASNVRYPRDTYEASDTIKALLRLEAKLGDKVGPSRRQRRAIVKHGLEQGEFYDMPKTAIEAEALLRRLDPDWGSEDVDDDWGGEERFVSEPVAVEPQAVAA